MTKRIADLEKLFKEANADKKLLQRLANELEFRSTARAASLLTEVQGALNNPKAVEIKAMPKAISADRGQQLSLMPEATVPKKESDAARAAPQSTQAPSQRPPAPSAPVTTHEPELKRNSPAAPEGGKGLDVAYQTLKVSRSASWYTIEMARRRIVSKASPTELRKITESGRATAIERARKANEASKRLWLELHN